MDNLLDAVADTVPRGVTKQIAPLMGMSTQILSNKLCPTNEHNHLTLVEASRLMEVQHDYQILRALADRHGFRIIPNDEKVSELNFDDLADGMTKEATEALQALVKFMTGHTDKKALLKELIEAIDSMSETRAHLEAVS